MSGKSPLQATAEQREALELQARVSDREEADRARGILLSLSGWTSIEIGQALRVREDTVRGEARPSCAMDFPGSRGGTRGRMAWNKQLAAS